MSPFDHQSPCGLKHRGGTTRICTCRYRTCQQGCHANAPRDIECGEDTIGAHGRAPQLAPRRAAFGNCALYGRLSGGPARRACWYGWCVCVLRRACVALASLCRGDRPASVRVIGWSKRPAMCRTGLFSGLIAHEASEICLRPAMPKFRFDSTLQNKIMR